MQFQSRLSIPMRSLVTPSFQSVLDGQNLFNPLISIDIDWYSLIFQYFPGFQPSAQTKVEVSPVTVSQLRHLALEGIVLLTCFAELVVFLVCFFHHVTQVYEMRSCWLLVESDPDRSNLLRVKISFSLGRFHGIDLITGSVNGFRLRVCPGVRFSSKQSRSWGLGNRSSPPLHW